MTRSIQNVIRIWSLMLVLQAGQAHGNPATNKLMPCPDSPNCVSSLAQDPKHHIEPFIFNKTTEEAKEKLLGFLRSLPQAQIKIEEKNFIHVEFSSSFMGFIDDVQFYLDEKKKTIHVRSGSRTGYWDFGKNRSRIEEIRTQLAAK